MLENSAEYLFWIQLKVDSLHLDGYENVTVADLEEYLNQFLWKRRSPDFYVDKINVIMNITANQFFDYQTYKIQKTIIHSLDELDFGSLI